MKFQNFSTFAFFLFLSILAPLQSKAEALSVAKFQKLAPVKGEFLIAGYVVKQYLCPPCPPDTFCKPCMRDNVLVSDADTPVTTYPNEKGYLVVFTKERVRMAVGNYYFMKVRVLDTKTTGYESRDVEMVSVESATPPSLMPNISNDHEDADAKDGDAEKSHEPRT